MASEHAMETEICHYAKFVTTNYGAASDVAIIYNERLLTLAPPVTTKLASWQLSVFNVNHGVQIPTLITHALWTTISTPIVIGFSTYGVENVASMSV